MSPKTSLPLLLILFSVLACGRGPQARQNQVFAQADRDAVFTVAANGTRTLLPAPDSVFLDIGQGVDVDSNGRAILQFADLFTVEVLRDGELTIQQLEVSDQAVLVTVVQNGGVLLNEFDPEAEIDKRFTVQTAFATVTAVGTRFLIVKEEGSPLEWVIALDAGPDDLEVTADGVTKPVESGVARWVAPIGEPSPGIQADMGNVMGWLSAMQSSGTDENVGDVLWPPADVLATTQEVAALPGAGGTFEISGVVFTLGESGQYWLEDCNQDGVQDVAMQDGTLSMDFRAVARVKSLDVTVLNRAGPDSGSLTALDPARQPVSSQLLSAGEGEYQVLSLRDEVPYHYAELMLEAGCFLGFSLTPPGPDGEPQPPRPAVETAPPPGAADFVRIDSPADGAADVTNPFTVSGAASVPFERTLVLRVETLDGAVLQEQPVFVEGGELGGEPGTFSAEVLVDFSLPLEVVVRVMHISMKDGSVVAEDSVRLAPLNPGEGGEVRRPPENGQFFAVPVAAYLVGFEIDGDPEEWFALAEASGVNFVGVDTIVYDEACLYDEPGFLSDDLSALVSFSYDETFLYGVFIVRDDRYSLYSGDEFFVFLGDAPQIILDLDLAGDFADRGPSRDDIEVDFHPGFLDGDTLFSPYAALWRLDTLEAAAFDEVLIGSRYMDGEGYVVEFAIPWKSLGVAPEAGSAFGLAASVSDNDAFDFEAQQCMVSSAAARDFRDPTTWGTLFLVGE